MHLMLALACALVASFALTVHAAPSYDCAKSMSLTEKEICRVPNLQWLDRQLARLYRLAREQAGASQDALVVQQRQFIVRREACRTDHGCLENAYKARLAELSRQVNVFEAFAEYNPASFGGSLWIARFGFNAGVSILTVGDAGHTCAFETDNAVITGKGLVKYHGGASDVCRLNVIPDGENMRIETKNCQDYCGMRAVMDGTYSRAK